MEKLAPAARCGKRALEPWDEHFAFAGGDYVGERRERLRVDERHRSADDDERVAFGAL